VEKEALASTWACEKFSIYLEGMPQFELRTDHRPLIELLASKPIQDVNPRIQRMRMRLARFNFNVVHVPGKYRYTADCLSRAKGAEPFQIEQDILEEEIDTRTVNAILTSLPMTDRRLREIREAHETDEITQEVIRYVLHGWPNRKEATPRTKPFFEHQADLHVVEGLLAKDARIYIPVPLQKDIIIRDTLASKNAVPGRANPFGSPESPQQSSS